MLILVGYGVCKPVDERFQDSNKVDEPDDAGDDDCIALGEGAGSVVLHGLTSLAETNRVSDHLHSRRPTLMASRRLAAVT